MGLGFRGCMISFKKGLYRGVVEEVLREIPGV